MSGRSLDDLLKKIADDSKASLYMAEDVDASRKSQGASLSLDFGTGRVSGSPVGSVHGAEMPTMVSTNQNPEDERNELWESNLTPRQRALPRIPAQMLGGIVAIFVLFAGVGAATFLSQQNQDLRQQAYEDTLDDLAGPSATLTRQQLEEQERLALGGGEMESTLPIESRDSLPEDFVASHMPLRSISSDQKVLILVAGSAIIFCLIFLVWLFRF